MQEWPRLTNAAEAPAQNLYNIPGLERERVVIKAVNRGGKRSRRYRYRHFAKFERSRRYRDRYRCQEKSLAAVAIAIWFFETPPAENESSIANC